MKSERALVAMIIGLAALVLGTMMIYMMSMRVQTARVGEYTSNADAAPPIEAGQGGVSQYYEQSLSTQSNSHPSDYQGEEAVWKETSPGVVRSSRSRLYWTQPTEDEFTNQFESDCGFFLTADRGSYEGPGCGEAIDYCAGLVLDANRDGVGETDWYLPALPEFLQANIDGIYNVLPHQANTFFWMSTELGTVSSMAHIGDFHFSYVNSASKGSQLSVYCVRRD